MPDPATTPRGSVAEPAQSTPRVSIVMGVHNGADLLADTLASVRAQTLTDWELIVVDDGSEDLEVRKRLSAAAAADARIRVLRRPHEGLTRALIAGCEAAAADCIARLDCGDAMHRERLDRQRRVLDANPGVALVSCWTEFCGPEWEPLYVRKEKPTPATGVSPLSADPDANVLTGPTHHGTVMFRRETYARVGGYRRQFYYGQDWDLWYRLAEAGAFVLIDEVLYHARVLPESISLSNADRQVAIGRLSLAALQHRRRGLDEGQVLSQAAAIRPSPQRATTARTRASGYRMIGEMLRRNRDPRSRRYLWQSIRLDPLGPVGWLRFLQSLCIRGPVAPPGVSCPPMCP